MAAKHSVVCLQVNIQVYYVTAYSGELCNFKLKKVKKYFWCQLLQFFVHFLIKAYYKEIWTVDANFKNSKQI